MFRYDKREHIINTGAITVIQRAFDKHLLLLVCRHHILEIISAAVFDKFFKSSGPQIALFGRFKEQWKFLDLTKHAAIDAPVSGVQSDLTNPEKHWLDEKRVEVVSFLENLISEEMQPRHDYLEFCKLSLIMLVRVMTVEYISVPRVPTIVHGGWLRASTV